MGSLSLLLAVALGIPGTRPQVQEGEPPDRSATSAPDTGLRTHLRAAVQMQERGEHALARARLGTAIAEALELLAARSDEELLELCGEIGGLAYQFGDLRGAQQLFEALLESAERGLGTDHPLAQRALQGLAGTHYALGDLQGARALFERLLEARERSLPAGHIDLGRTRLGLAATRKVLGDLEGALALELRVLEDFERSLPDDHPELLMVRQNLAGTLYTLGDPGGARTLYERVLEVRERSLGADHPDLQVVRLNLAKAVKALGDVQHALELERGVLESFERTLPEEHPNLQRARLGLGITLYGMGDLPGARALFERVLESFERDLPADHPELLWVRGNLAVTIRQLGDLRGARALEESVLEVRANTLPADHPDLQVARQNLAVTIGLLGDHEGAAELLREVLETMQTTLPADHPSLQAVRLNLALALKDLGDIEAALTLEQLALESFERTLPAGHADLLAARSNLAGTLYLHGDPAQARRLEESVLAAMQTNLPADHPDLQRARLNLVTTIARQLAQASAGEHDRQRCAALAQELARSQVLAARRALLTGSSREAEECAAGSSSFLSPALSLALDPETSEESEELVESAFTLSESTRAAALASGRIARGARGTPRHEHHAHELRSAGAALAELAQRGADPAELASSRARREAAERELLAIARELLGEEVELFQVGSAALAARSAQDEALVAYRCYTRRWFEASAPAQEGEASRLTDRTVYALGAFVLARAEPGAEARLSFIDLGPVDPIDMLVRSWREQIGASSSFDGGRGAESAAALRGLGLPVSPASEQHASASALRRLLWDPLVGALGEAQRVVIVADEVLHLVPFDALPLEQGELLLGDRWRIENRVAAWELLVEPVGVGVGGALVALGGASFDARPASADGELAPELESVPRAQSSGLPLPRAGAFEAGFAPLESTGPEAREIAQLFASLGQVEALVLEGRRASREALEGAAPGARWLHVATHGWFAPESVRSWSDVQREGRAAGPARRMSAEEVVRGLSPMLLCGLALAGASLPADSLGRVLGLITAEELSTLDLSSCELAVLSACDTNVGERRAGQGVASLQKALHMAGARSAITSLWKVPDAATRELMLDFYRRLWVEQRSKSEALWEAKQRLREARDEHGRPRYTTRDWAGWVLTGEPD